MGIHLRVVACTIFTLLMIETARGSQQKSICGDKVSCTISTGQYRIYFPKSWNHQTQLGAIYYLHGWNGTALSTISNRALRSIADKHKVALVAPQGKNGSWSFPGSPSQDRDEFQFFKELREDLLRRFPIDSERIMISGFSMGASMAWYLACYQGELYSGFAPVAGAFWKPIPKQCPSRLNFLSHIHGIADKTVPIAGRPIGKHWTQANLYESLDVWKRQAGFEDVIPHSSRQGRLTCKEWSNKTQELELCLHSGSHSIEIKWVSQAWVKLTKEKNWK
ncbi:alpha/beta hydrolase family esterase [Flexibacterium corallicola]|uniref:alpha/beta hydrolase family esterase n=1 Tax=Flexibacterium corallicola TaxID=3037259 RepID=UPI00286F0AF3|nr:alpha/beta hydrolase-fold protein [Pseudovibrio sp. M1P-2-3]